MTTPRFVPKQMVSRPKYFGTIPAENLGWTDPDLDGVNPVWRRAAQHQAVLAFAMNRHLLYKNVSLEAWCEVGGFSAQRLRRVLRGDVIMRLEDVAAFEIVSGVALSLKIALPAR